MATKTEITKNENAEIKAEITNPDMELVDFYAFKDDNNYSDDIVVGLNGKLWKIKRGENVKIPRCVRNIINQSIAMRTENAKKHADGEFIKYN